MLTILIILLILAAIGVLPQWPYMRPAMQDPDTTRGSGYEPTIWILVVILILFLIAR